MSSSNSWEPLFNGPNPPLAGLARDFEGYSFDTSGFGKDLEVEITQLPSERAKTATTDTINDAPSSPSPFPPSPFESTPYPFVDLSTLPTRTPVRAPNTLMISHPFSVPRPTPLPTPFVICDMNVFPALPGADADFQYPPARPDEFRVAADAHKHGLCDNEMRRAIGNSGANKENPVAAADKIAKPGKSKFNGNDLIGFVRATVDCNPWLATHGKKGLAWEETLECYTNQSDCRHPNITAAALQHKCEAMISFKKDPKGKNKNLAKVIGVGTSASITIAALLERMETQYDEAKDKSDDAKAALKKTNDANCEGGEAIRQASLRAMRRKRAPTPDTDDDAMEPEPEPEADADADSPDTNSTTKVTAASSSSKTIDADNDKKPAKRRRLTERRSASGKDALLDLMKEENKHRAEYDNRIANSLDTFVKDSREQKAEFASLLRDLISSERNN
ncbi:hypothetical protein B0H14DRAFT_3454379 [Mycena olivaceomarginata]|nr:hypothetical protein B0H14DRAFT_3454379 [Mycena olivaceomarginata]